MKINSKFYDAISLGIIVNEGEDIVHPTASLFFCLLFCLFKYKDFHDTYQQVCDW